MFKQENRSGWRRACSTLLACVVVTAPALRAQTPVERPKITRVSADLGAIQASAEMTLTVHLNLHDQQAFDQAVKGLYTSGSPTYRHWMTNNEIARYAPTSAEVETVTSALQSHGVSVLSIAPDHLSIRARGTAAAVESAFQTQIHQFNHEGKVFHANVAPATLAGAAGALVRGVSGLANFPMRPALTYQINPSTGERLTPIQATGSGFSGIATNSCFGNPEAVTLTSGGGLPLAVYVGNAYSTTSLPCSWTPSQLQEHYGLTPAYSQGLDGTGQTIVIVDGPTDGAQLLSDLTQFSNMAGLPPISSSNFTVLYPDGKPTPLSLRDDNWQVEASLDVEWAHSIAPGAKIVIEIMPTEDWTEFEFAIDYARQNNLGNVISNSYGLPEALFGAFTVQGFEQVLQTAAAAGIAVNFSSGDGADEGTGSPSGGGVLYPASSAYATSIGGTSIGIPIGTGGVAEVGWGTNANILSFALNGVIDPPLALGNIGGSGGGTSTFIAKPFWQSSIPGTARQSPDISALADPYTGAVFVEGGIAQAGIGGTSLACPIFSAIWAIAAQAAGKPLGQAAPLIYTLPSPAIIDVVPVNSTTNVTGIMVDSSGETDYSPSALLAPLYTTTQYYSTLWNIGGSGEYVDLSFGTDASLTVTPGWDNVTGLGVPNGLAFINAVVNAQ